MDLRREAADRRRLLAENIAESFGRAGAPACRVPGGGSLSVVEALIQCGFVESRGAARRLVLQGGVRTWDGEDGNERITAVDHSFGDEDIGLRIIVGKRRAMILPEAHGSP